MNNQTQVDIRLNNNSDNISSTNQNSNMDRLNLSNLMSQADAHSFWPYGQFIPQMNPQPTGLAMFQSQAFPYQLPAYQASNMSTNFDNIQPRQVNAGSTGGPPRNSDASNMLIQIGLQCVNQNNPININSLNDLSVPVVKALSGQENAINNLDSKVSPSNSPNSFAERNNFDTSFTKDYEKKLVNNRFFLEDPGPRVNPNFDSDGLSQEKFAELTRLAMRGSELAERLAYSHRNRPCFKKIDSLCARMKQDLIRPDGVLPNINSQGIAWAVKDFIFVFTRVINAWIIIKGYVYNTPEGLNKVKSALSPDFIRSFAAWQDTTMDFVENLIKSFVNLDHLVQSQKTAFQKVDNVLKNCSTPIKPPNCDGNSGNAMNFSTFDDSLDFLNTSNDGNISKVFSPNDNGVSLNKSYFSTLVEDSEESQRKATANGTYFKTGVYNPLQKDATDLDSIQIKKDLVDSVFEASTSKPFSSVNNDAVVWTNAMMPECSSNFYNVPVNGEGDGKLYAKAQSECATKTTNDWPYCNLKVLETNLSKFSTSFDPTISKPIGTDLREKLDVLLQRISNLSEGKYFFNSNFTRNYFPEFTAHYPDFMDIRSIILKAQVGGYCHIFEIIHDLKLIIFHAKNFLKTYHDDKLKNSITEYEKEINEILKDKVFTNLRFDHITGDPTESLYYVTKK